MNELACLIPPSIRYTPRKCGTRQSQLAARDAMVGVVSMQWPGEAMLEGLAKVISARAIRSPLLLPSSADRFIASSADDSVRRPHLTKRTRQHSRRKSVNIASNFELEIREPPELRCCRLRRGCLTRRQNNLTRAIFPSNARCLGTPYWFDGPIPRFGGSCGPWTASSNLPPLAGEQGTREVVDGRSRLEDPLE
jgi:hypothetical protein